QHHPAWEVELKPGRQGLGTSWSCAHGVGRWMEDCGCGSDGGHQKWRAPLRSALDWLRDCLAPIFEQEAAVWIKDPWQARDDYASLLLDPSEKAVSSYCERNMRAGCAPDARRSVLMLMEMQKNALFM